MAYNHSISIQMGHVPRTRGATGTVREQEFTRQLGQTLAKRLKLKGWTVELLNADPPGRVYPRTKYFLALHCDGSSNPGVGSASYFYPPRDADESWNWGLLWSAAHQAVAGYGFGFRRPNYVGAVSTGFYAWRASRLPDMATPAEICLLCEHYFATNPEEAKWAWTPGRISAMADAHVAALGKYTGGHPSSDSSIGSENPMIYTMFKGWAPTACWLSYSGLFRNVSLDSVFKGVLDGSGKVVVAPWKNTHTIVPCSTGQLASLRDTARLAGVLADKGSANLSIDQSFWDACPYTPEPTVLHNVGSGADLTEISTVVKSDGDVTRANVSSEGNSTRQVAADLSAGLSSAIQEVRRQVDSIPEVEDPLPIAAEDLIRALKNSANEMALLAAKLDA